MKLNTYYEYHVIDMLKDIDFSFLHNKVVLITGATGMIGSALVDMLLLANGQYDLQLQIYAVGRSSEKAKKRFSCSWHKTEAFHFLQHDVIEPFLCPPDVDVIVHAASNAYPAVFKNFPVETMLANFYGTHNLLNLARKNGADFVFISSGEVYGEIDKLVKGESDYGYVDSMEYRSCYPNSKRASETLCASYVKEYSVRALVARPSHVYGPTMTESDNRVVSDFIRRGKQGRPVILKSTGSTVRSYTYVLDVCSGIIEILKKGIAGEAYNIADESKILSIREMGEIISEITGCDFICKLEAEDDTGATSISRQVMSGNKLRNLGWQCKYDFYKGLSETLNCLKL